MNNPTFKGVEFDPLLFAAGSNAFTLSPSKWIETTNAKGLISKQGKNGGTEAAIVYANEADLLNMALFGKTAVQWRNENPKVQGNIRDDAALEQLVVLTNLESLNAVMIEQGIPSSDRLLQLNKIAIQQLKTLSNSSTLKKLY